MSSVQRCRWCGCPLSDLQRRLSEHCDASTCRSRTGERILRERRAAALIQIRAKAPVASAQAPVIWLQHREPVMTALTGEERAGHAAFLAAVAAEPQAHRRRSHLVYPEDQGPGPAADAVVCGFCRGRCCEVGKAHNGFIDADLLERHGAAHAVSLADAAAAYLAWLPDRHVADSCLYHGEQGCVLPRAARAPVCNGYACRPLDEARAQLKRPEGAVLVSFGERQLVAAAWAPDDQGPARRFYQPDSGS